MKMRWLLAVGLIAISFAGAWSFYQRRAVGGWSNSNSRPLAQVMPEGALLYLEARDFSSLLNDWNSSPEKTKWLESDNNRVFSESRMLLRLKRFYENFAVAAGAPPDIRFVSDAAGRESVFALYDIGKIEFLYVTHLPSAGFLNSVLWRSRNKFQPRSAGGAPFFICKDESSGQIVAFAIAGDYLLLSTREDLIAHTLELLGGQAGRSLQQEEWFSKAVSEASATSGDLRMVLNLTKIAVAPQFRTYWIQQNITEMKGYAAAVSDLYRQGRVYREERMLLRKPTDGTKESSQDSVQDQTESSASVAIVVPLVPPDSGFYQIRKSTPKEAVDMLEQKIISPRTSTGGPQSRAPQVFLTSGETGSESDLDTRIDVAPPSTKGDSLSPLRRQFEQAKAQAFLVVQGTRRNQDDVLLTMGSAMVIAASRDWDLPAVQSALQTEMASGMSVSNLGLGWKQVEQAGGYLELDGIRPLQLAVRGKLLYISNQSETMAAMLQAKNAEVQPQGMAYVSAFNHARERQSFYELTKDIDHSTQPASPYEINQPRFFSQNITSLSRTFARLESERVLVREDKGRVFQTVIYRWSD